MTDDPRTRAVTSWRAALADMNVDATWVAEAEAQELALGLTFRGEAAMHVAQPDFLTEADVAHDQQVADAVIACLVAAGEAMITDSALQHRYLGDWLRAMPDADLFALPSGYSDPVVLGRLDGARLADGLHILEFNGGLPGGVWPADGAIEVISTWPAVSTFAAHQPFRTLNAGDGVLDAVVSTWHDFGGSEDPFTVVALPIELTELAAVSLQYLKRRAAERGLDVAVADPGDLAHVDGRLRLDGRPVDVMIRAFFTTMTAYLGNRLDGVRSALRSGEICMITSMRSGLYGHKSLFAAITDPDSGIDVPESYAERAREHLPWTRMVTPGVTTTPDGSRADLLAYLGADRANLVLKPAEGYGGAGVELGWNHDDDSWAKAISTAVGRGGYIAQARVPLAPRTYSLLAPEFPVAEFTADQNPLIARGRIIGYFTRLTAGLGPTNLTAGGGSIAPTVIIDG